MLDVVSTIRVSDIAMYLRCPRKLYFKLRGHEDEHTAEYASHLVLKELALSYPAAVAHGDTAAYLTSELDRISAELPAIHSMDCALADSAVENVRALLPGISERLVSAAQRIGKDTLAGMITPFKVEPVLLSKRFGITGSPAKLVMRGDISVPSIIRTGNAPENGIWKNDRLALAAHAIMLEEMNGGKVELGLVEYAKRCEFREAAIRSNDRRVVLQVLKKIHKIIDGAMPDKPEGAPCQDCGHAGLCETKHSLASKFF